MHFRNPHLNVTSSRRLPYPYEYTNADIQALDTFELAESEKAKIRALRYLRSYV